VPITVSRDDGETSAQIGNGVHMEKLHYFRISLNPNETVLCYLEITEVH